MKKVIIFLFLAIFFSACGNKAETADSQLELARKYCDDRIAEKDFKKGMEYLHKSAKGGNAEAMHLIGFSYTGEYCGGSQDYTQAIKWLKQSADIGSTRAMVTLGVMYSLGKGVPQNKEEADKWFDMAEAEKDKNEPGSVGLKKLKRALNSGRDNAVMELILKDFSQDITPWLKNNIHNYDPAIMFVFVQRLINENEPLTEVYFWYTAARYRASTYLNICKYSPSGEEALFSSLSVMTRERVAYAFKDTPQWDDFITNEDFFAHANTKRLKEWDIKNEIPANFCEKGDKFTGAERKRQLADFRKKAFKDFDEKNQPARIMNAAGAADKPAPATKVAPTEVKPDPKEILYILSAISASQERAKLVQGGYVKEFGMLDIDLNDDNNKYATGRTYTGYSFKISLSDNPNGWVVSAERSVPGQRVLIIRNTKKGFCCHNFDPGQCELLEISENCAQFGLNIKPRK